MKTQVASKPFVLGAPDQRPLFAQEFVHMMADKGYEVLRAYMVKAQAAPEAVSLLDELVLLGTMRHLPEQVTMMENQSVVEALGSMSHLIVKLGGGGMLRMD